MSASGGSSSGEELDLAGGEGGSDNDLAAPAKPPTHRLRGKTSGNSSGRAAGSSASRAHPPPSAAASEINEGACFVCEEIVEAGGGPFFHYRGRPLHRQCSAAIRSHCRLISSDPPLRRKVDAEFWNDPQAWRARIRPLVCEPGKRRTETQRRMIQRSFNERFAEKVEQQRMMQLNLTHYIAYTTFWDRIDASRAEEQFWALVDDQSEEENSDGEVVVWVKDNRVKATTRGTRRGKRSMESGDDEPPPKSRKRGKPDKYNDFGDNDSDDDKDDSDFSMCDGEGDSKRGRATPRAKRSNSRPHGPPADGRAPRTSPRTMLGSAKKNEQHNGQVLLLRAKDELTKMAKREYEDISGPKSVSKMLKKKVNLVPKDQLGLLDLDAEVVMSDLDTKLLKPMAELLNDLPNLPLKDVAARRSQVEALVRDKDSLLEPGRQLIAAITYMKNSNKEIARKDTAAERYKVDRLQAKLQNGGYGKTYARTVSTAYWRESDPASDELPSFVDLNADALRFDTTMVNRFAAPGAPHSFMAFALACKETGAAAIEEKSKDIKKVIKKKGWRSAMCKVEGLLGWTDDFVFQDARAYADEKGGEGWVLGLKANVWRFAAGDVHMPGVAQFFLPIDGDMTLSVFAIAPLLAEGIGVGDLHSFLESPSGAQFVKEHASIFQVKLKQGVYIPFGFVAVPLYCQPLKEADDKEMIGTALHLPIFSPQLASALPEPVWNSVISFNQKFLNKVKDSRPWASRHQIFERFVSAATAKTSS